LSGRLRLALAAATIALLGALPTAAQAALIDTSLCDGAALSQPFARWADDASYKLAPGGDFEGALTGWTLTGKAAKVAGNEPWSGGRSSLSIPAGSSATSAPTCVNAANPSYRFFVRSSGGLLGLVPAITVSLVYRDSVLGLVALPLGIVFPSSSWTASPVELTLAALPAALANGSVPLSLRFASVLGTWTVDDVYVDPHQRG
jgi:hypothetical protein